VEVVAVDNRNDAKVALRNAAYLIREQVDLVIEFQTHDAVAADIAAKYFEARIPVIAIDIPHPGATYFGANHYGAGLIGGRHLGRWAKKHWSGEVDEVLMIELTRAGPLPRTAIRGIMAGIREVLRLPDHCVFSQVDGDGQFGTALDRVRKHLRSTTSTRILVGAANDSSALGALRAFDECGRTADCVVVGQNAEPEGRAELREPRTRLIGSVAYFPEKYGEGLIRLALDLLARKPAPPAVFIKHQLVTPENVDHLYPNDTLMGLVRAGS
jgi:ribose transport system substrate-binding protein